MSTLPSRQQKFKKSSGIYLIIAFRVDFPLELALFGFKSVDSTFDSKIKRQLYLFLHDLNIILSYCCVLLSAFVLHIMAPSKFAMQLHRNQASYSRPEFALTVF